MNEWECEVGLVQKNGRCVEIGGSGNGTYESRMLLSIDGEIFKSSHYHYL